MNLFAKWKKFVFEVSREMIAVWMSFRRPGVSWLAKLIGVAGLLYCILPVDLIPDIIPFAGWLDDIVMVPLLSVLAARFIRPDVMNNLRAEAERLLFRFGPRVLFWLAVVVLAWSALVVMGAALWWWNWNRREVERPAVFHEQVQSLPHPGQVQPLTPPSPASQ